MDALERVCTSGRTVAVLCGGNSTEREVSLVSGRAVAQALAGMGIPHQLLELPENRLPDGLDASRHVVLPLIHGTYGEDGRLSAELDQAGIPYGGCDQAASVLCFDKLASKAIAARIGLPVAADRLLLPENPVPWQVLREATGIPFILKPRRDGSSVGLHLVKSSVEYASAGLDLARSDYLAEAYLDGTDLTVGILGEEALGVVAVHPEGGLYDYQHKYTSGLSRYEVPAAIDPGLADQLREWSLQLFRACGCRDLARVDFRLGRDGSVIFLEINTLPGMTPTSLLPKSAQCREISFNSLVLRWIGFSLNRIS